MKIEKINLLFALILFFNLNPSELLAADEAPVLVKINNVPVLTLDSFEKKYQDNVRFFGETAAPSKQQLLDDLIKREVGILEAKKMGLEKRADVIDRMNTVLYQAFLEEKLTGEFDKIVISDAEAKSYYGNNPEIRTSHIYVRVPAGASKEVEQKALAEIKSIQDEYLNKKKMNFIEVAQKYSQALDAPTGGDIDYKTADKLDKNYYAAAKKLSMNGVSGIVRSNVGYHIIRLTGKKSWEQTDQAGVKRLLLEQKKQEIYNRYMQGLRNKTNVAVKSELLKN